MIPAQLLEELCESREQERDGVVRAGETLRMSMQSSMERIVRRVARRKQAASASEREILGRLSPGVQRDVATVECEENCRDVAKQMCDQLLDRWFAECDRQADTVALSQPMTVVVT